MAIDQKKVLEILYILSIKVLIAINIYYFFQFYKGSGVAIFCLIVFYIFERIFIVIGKTTFIGDQISKISDMETLQLIVLSIFYLEELFFLQESFDEVRKTRSFEIPSFVFLLLLIPAEIVAFIYTIYNLSYFGIILFTLNLTFYFLSCFLITLYQVNPQQLIPYKLLKVIKEFFIGLIHFVSYIWLLFITLKFQTMGIIPLIVFSILFLVNYILDQKKNEGFDKSDTFIEIFYIIYHDQDGDNLQSHNINNIYKFKIFSFLTKICLLLPTFFCKDCLNNTQEIQIFFELLLFVSVISVLNQGYNIYINKSDQSIISFDSYYYKIFCLVIYKSATVIKIYYFIQFIMVNYFQINIFLILIQIIKQEDNNSLTQIFLWIYILQRFTAVTLEYQFSDSKLFNIFFLNIFQIDEFSILNNEEQTFKFCFYISLFSLPLDIITLIWTLDNVSLITIIFQFFIWLVFYQLIYSYSLQMGISFNSSYTFKIQDLFQFLKAYLLTMIHFASYVCLICMNYCFNFLNVYFLLFMHVLLAISLIKSIRKMKEYSDINEIFYILQQLIHIVIDTQDLIDFGRITYKNTKLTNNLNNHSFIMKLYLFLTFIFQYKEYFNNNQEFFFLGVTILIISLISVLILSLNLLKNTILADYFGSHHIQFDNYDNFIDQAYYKNSWISKQRYSNKKLKMIQIFSEDKMVYENLIFTELLLFNFDNCEIKSHWGSRQLINKGQWLQVSLYIELPADEIQTIIEERNILPQVLGVQLYVKDEIRNVIKLYSKLAENNLGVHFTTNIDNQEISTINQQLFEQVKFVCTQIKASEKYLLSQQVVNPQMIMYDLYEDLLNL